MNASLFRGLGASIMVMADRHARMHRLSPCRPREIDAMMTPIAEPSALKPAPRVRASVLLATGRLGAFFLSTIALYVCLRAQKAWTRGEARRLTVSARWARRWARLSCRLLGVRVSTHGTPPPAGCLIAPNHFTWLDVIVLMGVTPTFFVSRADVARWPVAGFFARGVGTIFIKRSRAGRDLVAAGAEIVRRLSLGQSVAVFLEGTTSDGRDLLPFRPSLVETAIQAHARVVPTALLWHAARPGIDLQEDVGYFGDQSFARQAWRLLGLGRAASCEVAFGEPMDATGQNRKALAARVEAEVRRLKHQAS
jgi:1-acyl-sn-glycerol-3-phosphate acyltransferase